MRILGINSSWISLYVAIVGHAHVAYPASPSAVPARYVEWASKNPGLCSKMWWGGEIISLGGLVYSGIMFSKMWPIYARMLELQADITIAKAAQKEGHVLVLGFALGQEKEKLASLRKHAFGGMAAAYVGVALALYANYVATGETSNSNWRDDADALKLGASYRMVLGEDRKWRSEPIAI
ncbi:MAG: hypothetical protein QG632_150 [Candidatus Dependentiae bacterium]|nr:hypothetical protein [Candidatus Dependentiae bacterium]